MSSLTALLLLAAQTAGQAPALAGIAAAEPAPALSAEAALANERAMIVAAPAHCGTAPQGEIVVCARRSRGPGPRLPFPEQRAEEGEVVRYAGEPDTTAAFDPHSCARPGSCDPPKLGATLGKIFNWIAGNDPDPDVP